jgi:carbon starvation protein
MLLEGLVAVIALSTVMILAKGDALTDTSPDRIYAEGLSRFVSHFGVPQNFARAFALLAFTTFIYDTLDVATRLARYIFEELTGWKGSWGRIAATAASLAIPLVCVSQTLVDAQGNAVPAWKVFWTIFGTSNQLLAGLTLMILSLWLRKAGRSPWISIIPMVFMMTMTIWSLALMVRPLAVKWMAGQWAFDPSAFIAVVLSALALMLGIEAAKKVFA